LLIGRHLADLHVACESLCKLEVSVLTHVCFRLVTRFLLAILLGEEQAELLQVCALLLAINCHHDVGTDLLVLPDVLLIGGF
jgi:hypothetical protein